MDITAGLPRICALFRGESVPVSVRDVTDDWSQVQATGVVQGRTTGVRPRRLRELTGLDTMARVFMFEMYNQNYKATDVDPRHFEVLLAAMLGGDDRIRGLRSAARGRISPVEAMALGQVKLVAKDLVSQLDRSGSLEIEIAGPTFGRMLGRSRR